MRLFISILLILFFVSASCQTGIKSGTTADSGTITTGTTADSGTITTGTTADSGTITTGTTTESGTITTGTTTLGAVFTDIAVANYYMKGGYFQRIDDPMIGDGYSDSVYQRQNIDTTLMICESHDIDKITWAVVTEYHFISGDTIEPYSGFMPHRVTQLNRLVNAGHQIANHSVNHSSNYYISHIDSLWSEDSILVADGYDISDGVDTIIINDSDTALYTWYWKHQPDDHYALGAARRIIDKDDDIDSIYMYAALPPRSVFIATYPNRWGLKRIIDVWNYRAGLVGLPETHFFIMPGQDYYQVVGIDTLLKEASGYVETAVGEDTVIFHVQEAWSSKPYVVNNYNNNWLSIGPGDRYQIDYNDVTEIDDTTFHFYLTGYTGDGNNHDADLVPNKGTDWMWQVEPDTLLALRDSFPDIQGSLYPAGRQYMSKGYFPKSEDQKFPQRDNDVFMDDDHATAKHSIALVLDAALKHYFIASDEHGGFQGGYARVDSFYNFIMNEPYITTYSNHDLLENMYSAVPDSSQNIVPSMDFDLNEDDVSDAWELVGSPTWSTLPSSIESTNKYFECDESNYLDNTNIWAVSPGVNRLSLWLQNVDSDSVMVELTEHRYRANTSNQTYKVYIEEKFEPDSTFTEYYFDRTVPSTTDYIDIKIQPFGGTCNVANVKFNQ